MVVYGDPEFTSSTGEALRFLGTSFPPSPKWNLAACRDFLIAAGQLEQGLADALPFSEPVLKDIAQRLTDEAADLFLSLWKGKPYSVTPVREALASASTLPDISITLKVPEGFAFYSLYPEQYILAAGEWLVRHKISNDNVAVIGLRSIGTTLSAIVASVLRSAGVVVHRLTLRPKGHPFQRHVRLPDKVDASSSFLVVDEGPGLSGSSMSAVAEALAIRGINPSQMFFLPAHDRDPSSFSAEGVRTWWTNVTRIAPSPESLRWSGHTLVENLSQHSASYLQSPCNLVTNLSAGRWRGHFWTDRNQWPAINAKFEQTKFLCRTISGKSILWKFAGLGPSMGLRGNLADAHEQRLHALASKGYTVAPLGTHLGYIALPWISSGKPLSTRDCNREFLEHATRYILDCSLPPQTAAGSLASFARLKHMLFWNIQKSCGHALAEQVRQRMDQTEPLHQLPTYGDGHLAPHEWIAPPGKPLLKLDAAGHQLDHTVIGEQTILWDIAGLCVEWNLSPAEVAQLQDRFRSLGLSFSLRILELYKLAYHSLKLGLLSFALEDYKNDPIESTRLCATIDRHREYLLHNGPLGTA